MRLSKVPRWINNGDQKLHSYYGQVFSYVQKGFRRLDVAGPVRKAKEVLEKNSGGDSLTATTKTVFPSELLGVNQGVDRGNDQRLFHLIKELPQLTGARYHLLNAQANDQAGTLQIEFEILADPRYHPANDQERNLFGRKFSKTVTGFANYAERYGVAAPGPAT